MPASCLLDCFLRLSGVVMMPLFSYELFCLVRFELIRRRFLNLLDNFFDVHPERLLLLLMLLILRQCLRLHHRWVWWIFDSAAAGQFLDLQIACFRCRYSSGLCLRLNVLLWATVTSGGNETSKRCKVSSNTASVSIDFVNFLNAGGERLLLLDIAARGQMSSCWWRQLLLQLMMSRSICLHDQVVLRSCGCWIQCISKVVTVMVM